MMSDTAGVRRPVPPVARRAWGLLALLMLAWTLLEVVKHRGWTTPLAVLGLSVPFLSPLARRFRLLPPEVENRALALGYDVLHGPRMPLAILVLVAVAPNVLPSADTTAVPTFTFGLGWLTHIALKRALGIGALKRGSGTAA